MKEAGFPQETYFFWYPKDHKNGKFIEPGQYHVLPFGGYYDEVCACPTEGELLKALTGCGCELYEQLDAPRWFAIAKRYHNTEGRPLIVNEPTPIKALAALYREVWGNQK